MIGRPYQISSFDIYGDDEKRKKNKNNGNKPNQNSRSNIKPAGKGAAQDKNTAPAVQPVFMQKQEIGRGVPHKKTSFVTGNFCD